MCLYVRECECVCGGVRPSANYKPAPPIDSSLPWHGHHNTTPQTGGLNNRDLHLTVPEAASPRSRCLPIWFQVKALLLNCRWLTSHISSSHGLSSVQVHVEYLLSAGHLEDKDE